MRCLILYPRSTTSGQNTAFDWLHAEAERFGVELRIAFFEDCRLGYDEGESSLWIEGERYAVPDVALMRGYDLGIARHLELAGVRMVNDPLAMEFSRDKLLTHQILCRAGISTPRTVAMEHERCNYNRVSEIFGSTVFVAKARQGSKGEQVWLVDNEEIFNKILITNAPHELIFQEYIATSRGRDLRIWVIGERVVGSVLRYNEGAFLSNFAQGGKARTVELSEQAIRLAITSCQALGLSFAGVDLLYTAQEGYTVCEVNANAGFRTHSMQGFSDERSIPYQLFEYISSLKS